MIGKPTYSILLYLLAQLDGVGGFIRFHLEPSSRRLPLLFAIPPNPTLHPMEQRPNKADANSDIVEMQMINDNDEAFEPYADYPYLMDEKRRPIGLKNKLHLQSPHSGRKFRPTHPNSSSTSGFQGKLRSVIRKLSMRKSKKPIWNALTRNHRRFTEGWYYRLTLPEHNESFVFIFSIEDAGRYVNGKKSPLTLACMQMLGPCDTYLVQSVEDDAKFWGWKHAHALGCTFEWKKSFVEETGKNEDLSNIAALTPEEWRGAVQSGFQILPFHFQGRLCGHDGMLGGVKVNQGKNKGIVEYDFEVQPVAGWGNYPPLSSSLDTNNVPSAKEHNEKNNHYRQLYTAGWLASFPVFEPHWQVTMAHARASGCLNWNGTVYNFKDAPFYGEKNWGGAFPKKWYWAQCNSFDDYPDLAFTSGGGIRQLPFSFLPGKQTETLGLIGRDVLGGMALGSLGVPGRCTDKKGETPFEAEIVAVTDDDVSGVLLRAPTKDEGMQYFCRDSGFGNIVLSLWELKYDDEIGDFIRSRTIIDRARSRQCTVEVGGGPWYDVWRVKSKMSSTLKKLIRLPMIMRKS